MCPVAMANLNYILERCPDVGIIVHSSIAKHLDWETFKSVLMLNGFNLEYEARLLGVPPRKLSSDRWDEIRFYLRDHPNVKEYMVLDDRTPPESMKENTIVVNQRTGLMWGVAKEVIEYFGHTVDESRFVDYYGFLQTTYDKL
jgi:hypothetical protein